MKLMSKDENKASKYTDAEAASLAAKYNSGKGMSIDELSKEFDRPKKSIIGKLVNMKVYVKPEQAIKTREDEGPSKKDLIGEFKTLGFSEAALTGLNNATKTALVEVLERVKAAQAVEVSENDSDMADVA